MRIFRHSKTPKAFKKARKANRRKASNFKTRERLFGVDFPAFGASLGALFDPLSGIVSKKNKAGSMGIRRLYNPSQSLDAVLQIAGPKTVDVSATFQVTGALYDSISTASPADQEDIVKAALAEMYGIDPDRITIINIAFASISVNFSYQSGDFEEINLNYIGDLNIHKSQTGLYKATNRSWKFNHSTIADLSLRKGTVTGYGSVWYIRQAGIKYPITKSLDITDLYSQWTVGETSSVDSSTFNLTDSDADKVATSLVNATNSNANVSKSDGTSFTATDVSVTTITHNLSVSSDTTEQKVPDDEDNDTVEIVSDEGITPPDDGGDSTPVDSDGDGVLDPDDDAPEDPNIQTDVDDDGIDDSVDPDFIDTDNDGIVDAQDPDQMDSDGDGVVDSQDPDLVDSDGDGVVDAQDHAPNDPDVTVDADGDGIDDSVDLDKLDTDSDGTFDASDDFPDDATKTSALNEYDVYGSAPYRALYKSFYFVSASYSTANGTYFLQTNHGSLGESYRISTYDNEDPSTHYSVSWNNNANRYDLNLPNSIDSAAKAVSHNGYLDTGIINGYAVTEIVRQDGPNPAYVQETVVDGVTKYTYPLYKNTYLIGDHLAYGNPPRYHKHEINGEIYYMPDAPLANHAVDSKTPAISNLAEYTADLEGVSFTRASNSYNSVPIGNETYYDKFTTPSFFTLSLTDGVNVILSRTTEPEKQTLIGIIDNAKRIYFMPGWSFENKTSENPGDPISSLDLIYTAPDLKTIV